MYIFITQCFASRVGGIESLMTNFAINLAKSKKVLVFADQHFFIQDRIFDLKNQQILKIFRYGGIKFFRKHKKAKDIKLLIQNNNVDGIIADTWKSLELCIKDINEKKIPVICLAHGNELIYKSDNRKKRIINTLSKINKIVANSNYTSQLLKRMEIKEENIFIVNPGAKDLRSLQNNNSYKFSGNPIILTLARLEKRKGHEQILKAIKKLKDEFPNINYIIAGEGPEKKYLSKQVKKFQLVDSVFFLGSINDNQKKEIFDLTSLVVMPTLDESSKRSIEGFGIVFIEGAMFGIPSIASDVGGTSDAIVDGQTGILLKKNDDLFLTIRNLLNDNVKLKRLGQKAQERALKNFKWSRVVENYLNVFLN